MLHATRKDATRVEEFVSQYLNTIDNPNVRFAMVSLRYLYDSCQLQDLRRSKFAEEVADLLTHTTFIQEHGFWLFTEYEGDDWMLTKVFGRPDKEVDRTFFKQQLAELVKTGALVGADSYLASMQREQLEDDGYALDDDGHVTRKVDPSNG